MRAASPYRQGSWRLSTEESASLDIRKHVDQLLDLVEPASRALAELKREGVHQDVFCFWATGNGQGGPVLDPSQMGRLAAVGLPILFDIYRS